MKPKKRCMQICFLFVVSSCEDLRNMSMPCPHGKTYVYMHPRADPEVQLYFINLITENPKHKSERVTKAKLDRLFISKVTGNVEKEESK